MSATSHLIDIYQILYGYGPLPLEPHPLERGNEEDFRMDKLICHSS